MKEILCGLAFLLLTTFAFAQKPQFTIHAGGGPWYATATDSETAYADPFKRWFPSARAGIEVNLFPEKKI
jgi:hypothetical protein